MAEPKKIDIREILQLARRRKWFLIIPPILALAVGFYQVSQIEPEYKSSTTIFFQTNLEILPDLQSRLGVKDNKRPQMRNEEENIRKQLLSSQILGQVIDEIQLKPSQGMLEQAAEVKKSQPDADASMLVKDLQIQWLRKRLTENIIFPKRGSYVEISFIHKNPNLAYDVVRVLADVFIKHKILNERLPIEGTRIFSEEHLEKYRAKYETAVARLRAYKVRMIRENSSSLIVNATNEENIISRINSLTVDISRLARRINELEAETGLPISQLTISENIVASDLNRQMMDKTEKLAALVGRFSWKDAEVIKVNQDISGLKEQYRSEIVRTGERELRGYLDPKQIELAIKRQMAILELELLNHEKSQLEDYLSSFTQRQAQRPSEMIEIAELEKEVQRLAGILDAFKEQTEGTKLKDDLTRTDANIRYRIIDPASRPVSPITDDPNRIILLATVGGLGLGVGCIYALEFFDHSFKSVVEVESQLGLAVLGTIPRISSIENKKGK